MESKHLENVAWLHSVYKSSIFLNMWRDIGSHVILATAGIDQKASGIQKKDEKESTEDQIARLDHAAVMKENALDHNQVMTQLVPAVQKRWKGLRDSIKEGSISVPKLEDTFGRLGSIEDYVAELIILSTTADGKAATEAKSESGGFKFPFAYTISNLQSWREDAILKLQDFTMLTELRTTVPAILNLRKTYLASLFKEDETRDPLYSKFEKLSTTLMEQWSKL
eukprot:1063171-Amorphochlora_amoeboformis.AAC.1